MVKWWERPTGRPVNALCSPVAMYEALKGQQPGETGSARGSSDRGEGLEETAGGRPQCCPGCPQKRQGGKKCTCLTESTHSNMWNSIYKSRDLVLKSYTSVFKIGFADRWARAEETETWGQKPSDRMPARENAHQKPHPSQGGKSSSGGKGL